MVISGAAAVLMLVLDRRVVLFCRAGAGGGAGSGSAFRFAGAAAVLVLVLVRALALDRRFVLRHARDDIMSCPERHRVMPGMTPCHAQKDSMSCQG